jgi:hypothetical protein
MIGRRIGRHQHLIADRHPRVHDLVLAFRRRRHFRRTFFVAQHHLDLSAKRLFVKLERRLAVAVIEQVGIQHHFLLG